MKPRRVATLARFDSHSFVLYARLVRWLGDPSYTFFFNFPQRKTFGSHISQCQWNWDSGKCADENSL